MKLDEFFNGALTRYFKDHLEATGVPQTYDEHKDFAVGVSLGMIAAGMKGVIHGHNPKLFPFDGSTTIIKDSRKIIESGRHIEEMIKEGLEEYIKPEFLDAGYMKARREAKKQGGSLSYEEYCSNEEKN